MIWLAWLAGFGIGLAAGVLVVVFTSVRSMTESFTRLRYDGFRAEPAPSRPKLVPRMPKLPRED